MTTLRFQSEYSRPKCVLRTSMITWHLIGKTGLRWFCDRSIVGDVFTGSDLSPVIIGTISISVLRSSETWWLPRYYSHPIETTIRKSASSITMTWASWRLKSLAARLFVQFFVQANNNKHIKAPHCWSCVKRNDGFPSRRASNAESVSVSWRHHATSNTVNSQYLVAILIPYQHISMMSMG